MDDPESLKWSEPHNAIMPRVLICAAIGLLVACAWLAYQRLDSEIGPRSTPAPESERATVSKPPSTAFPDSEQRVAITQKCVEAYTEWIRQQDEHAKPETGFAPKAVALTKGMGNATVSTVVLTNGRLRLVCSTQPSSGLREPRHDTVLTKVTERDFWFSNSSMLNYGFDDNDLVWAGGRLQAR
jgi:hypothetical protein